MPRQNNAAISIAVFIAGLCSIIYELLISTTATYFLGNSVKQFSVIIGIYLASMGLGAWFSKFLKDNSLLFFVRMEYVLGLIGGISVPLLYYFFIVLPPAEMQYMTWLLIFVIGLITGLEVPLLTFAVKQASIKDSLSNILSLDYIGGLAATLLFPFVLLPFIGLYYSSLLFGLVNVVLGLFMVSQLDSKRLANSLWSVIPAAILVLLMVFGNKLLHAWDMKIYKAPIAYHKQTPHQLIVLTKKGEDVRLYLNRVIQFSSLDEHRYHETLVHPVMMAHPSPKRILVLGGGEHLAAREILKHKSVEHIDIVDLDTTIFHLAKTHPLLKRINQNSAVDARITQIGDDAMTYLANTPNYYDIIISDLPDPNSEATAKLYTRQFFALAKNRLTSDGIFITQAGEIYFSNTAFSCIVNTMETVFDTTSLYHTYVPSFGDWGFVIGAKKPIHSEAESQTLPERTRYLTLDNIGSLAKLPSDINVVHTSINSLDHPVILNYYLDDWNKWKPDLVDQM